MRTISNELNHRRNKRRKNWKLAHKGTYPKEISQQEIKERKLMVEAFLTGRDVWDEVKDK